MRHLFFDLAKTKSQISQHMILHLEIQKKQSIALTFLAKSSFSAMGFPCRFKFFKLTNEDSTYHKAMQPHIWQGNV